MAAITRLDDPAIDELCEQLASLADSLDLSGSWPRQQLAWCREVELFRVFAPADWGGLDWSETDVLALYMRLAAACLTTTFILTQPHGVIRRLAESSNDTLRGAVLPSLVHGEQFASVGISQLTTSRRHLAQPAMRARAVDNHFILDGLCPWVTGGVEADYVLTGAQFEDGRQLLAIVHTNMPGVTFDPPSKMVGLTATLTGSMRCRSVRIDPAWVMAGPIEDVMKLQRGARTGSLQTSSLAVGLSTAAIEFLEEQAQSRPELQTIVPVLRQEQVQLRDDLLQTSAGTASHTTDSLRSRANLLALRTTQSALTAAKGTGYLQGHSVGRWCREALFFLVWSCPQPVASATLCELAGIP
jgi:alkylation response protein AidB-like acyl-CoA dehydrogenase